MSETKPLHVRVGEVLGWTRTHYPGDHGFGVPGPPCGDILLPDPERMRWKGRAPGELLLGADCTPIPRYDTDWAATGPLIEKYAITLGFALSERHDHRFEWIASENISDCRCIGRHEWDQSPLVAVCRLLIEAVPNGFHECSREALKAAGKL